MYNKYNSLSLLGIGVVAIKKEAFGSPSSMVANFTLLIIKMRITVPEIPTKIINIQSHLKNSDR